MTMELDRLLKRLEILALIRQAARSGDKPLEDAARTFFEKLEEVCDEPVRLVQ